MHLVAHSLAEMHLYVHEMLQLVFFFGGTPYLRAIPDTSEPTVSLMPCQQGQSPACQCHPAVSREHFQSLEHRCAWPVHMRYLTYQCCVLFFCAFVTARRDCVAV